jgi:catechol 2,3-dioxygenase-like lactoylglutathione lyase family enzyme
MTIMLLGILNDTTKTNNNTMNKNASTIMVRYIVNDVEASVAFYTNKLRFHATAQSGSDFAIVARENLQIVLSPPKGPGGGSQPMPDGRRPEPGGWNRIILPTSGLEKDVERLKKAGVKFRNDITSGPGGKQILIEDPSANLIELFEAARD